MIAVAIALALTSALAFATATVIEHRVATSAPPTTGPGALFRLVAHVVRHPGWLAGQGAAAVGLVLHALALRHGPVIIVQPLIASGLAFSLVLGALIDRRHPGRPLPSRRQWAATGIMVAGLTLFLLCAHPSRGTVPGRAEVLLLSVVAFGVLAGGAALYARRATAPHRSVVLGLVAGCGFGVVAILLKEVVVLQPAQWPFSWPVYALLVVGGMSMAFTQWAYHSGTLIQSLPVLTVVEPLVAIALAWPAYSERLGPGLAARTGQAVGVVLLTVGVAILARHSERPTPNPVYVGAAPRLLETSSGRGGRNHGLAAHRRTHRSIGRQPTRNGTLRSARSPGETCEPGTSAGTPTPYTLIRGGCPSAPPPGSRSLRRFERAGRSGPGR